MSENSDEIDAKVDNVTQLVRKMVEPNLKQTYIKLPTAPIKMATILS